MLGNHSQYQIGKVVSKSIPSGSVVSNGNLVVSDNKQIVSSGA